MTSRTTTLIEKTGNQGRYPDFPPRDDLQNWRYLYRTGIQMALQVHFAPDPSITVACEVPVGPSLSVRGDVRIPDLSVMKGGDDELMEAQGGYAIDQQGKAPDFVLEVASPSTGVVDYTDKREDYARYGVAEYWRFDSSGGDYHDEALAGERLVDGQYEPIVIETLGNGLLRGYSEALDLYLCWEYGMLRFFDPKTGGYLRTHAEDLARADEERRARLIAEARAVELEAELRRLRDE